MGAERKGTPQADILQEGHCVTHLKPAGALEQHLKSSAALVTLIAIGLSGALGPWSRSVFMGKLFGEDLSGTCTCSAVQTRVLFSPQECDALGLV